MYVCVHVCVYVSSMAGTTIQVWLDERPLGGVEVVALPEMKNADVDEEMESETVRAGGCESVLRREIYVCKMRARTQMQWRCLRVSIVRQGEGRGGDGREGGLVILSNDAVWFAEMDKLFELGGVCVCV